jgi:hypothetical protein
METRCPKSWIKRVGDSERRFCEDCKLHVHNLSEISDKSRQELMTTDQRVCVTYYLAPDGTFVSFKDLSFLQRVAIKCRIHSAELLVSTLASLLTFLRHRRGAQKACNKAQL